jgi:hypothetical protein
MQLVGWRSRVMVQRYVSSTASERARANYKEIAPAIGWTARSHTTVSTPAGARHSPAQKGCRAVDAA